MSDYIYLGDRLTDPALKGATCNAVRRTDGKCIRKRGAMLVTFEDGRVVNVIGRLLRLSSKYTKRGLSREPKPVDMSKHGVTRIVHLVFES